MQSLVKLHPRSTSANGALNFLSSVDPYAALGPGMTLAAYRQQWIGAYVLISGFRGSLIWSHDLPPICLPLTPDERHFLLARIGSTEDKKFNAPLPTCSAGAINQ